MKYGIEIECIYPRKDLDLNNYYDIKFTDKSSYSCDLSIATKNPAMYPLEVKTIPFEYNQLSEVVTPICEKLQPVSTVNKTCGLHVHVDMKQFSDSDIRKIMIRYANCEPELEKLFPSHRRSTELSAYLNSVKYADLRKYRFRGLRRGVYPTPIDNIQQSRYFNVNIHSLLKFGTMEFRQHPGTIKQKSIENWVKFLDGFIANAVSYKNTPSIRYVNSEYAKAFGRDYNIVNLRDDLEDLTQRTLRTDKGDKIKKSLRCLLNKEFSDYELTYDGGKIIEKLFIIEERLKFSKFYSSEPIIEDSIWKNIDPEVVKFYKKGITL